MQIQIPAKGSPPCSVMIVSERESFGQVMSEVFPPDGKNVVTSRTESFKSMNGHAGDIAFKHDVVIFEADPDDDGEVQAVRDLLGQRSGDTVFLAMTGNDVSISKARQLRDIGVDDVLPLSISGDDLRSTITEKLETRRAPQQRETSGGPALGKVIAVTQARGGIGATTVAVNLACNLVGKSTLFHKAEKRRVALLDLDLQFGNTNVFLDLEDNGGFLQLLEAGKEPDARFVASAMQSHPLGIDVLSAPVQVVPLHAVPVRLVEQILDLLQQQYDYIVVDLPRALVEWVEPVIRKASQLVLVTDTTVPCVRQARRQIDFYREDNVGLPIEVVVNREKRPMIRSEHVREAEKILKTSLTHWLPENPGVAREAVDLGRPVAALKPRSDLGKALAKTALALSVGQTTEKRKSI